MTPILNTFHVCRYARMMNRDLAAWSCCPGDQLFSRLSVCESAQEGSSCPTEQCTRLEGDRCTMGPKAMAAILFGTEGRFALATKGKGSSPAASLVQQLFNQVGLHKATPPYDVGVGVEPGSKMCDVRRGCRM